MIVQYQHYLTFENIYLWTNFGVLPFWLLIIFAPNSKITGLLVNSIILPLILGVAYTYTVYQTILSGESLLDIFQLYSGLDDLYTVFATEGFLLFFWLHFLALSLFLGIWTSKDAVKYNIPRSFTMITLVIIYFTGPLGIVLYWFVRVFYAKKLGFHD